jgi:hypothetical protein
MIMTLEFWKKSGETAIRVAAASAIGALGTGEILTAFEINWLDIGGIALLAGVVSILGSLAVPEPAIREARRGAKRALEAERLSALEAAEKKSKAAAKRKASNK